MARPESTPAMSTKPRALTLEERVHDDCNRASTAANAHWQNGTYNGCRVYLRHVMVHLYVCDVKIGATTSNRVEAEYVALTMLDSARTELIVRPQGSPVGYWHCYLGSELHRSPVVSAVSFPHMMERLLTMEYPPFEHRATATLDVLKRIIA